MASNRKMSSSAIFTTSDSVVGENGVFHRTYSDGKAKCMDILDKCVNSLHSTDDMKEFYKKWAPDYEEDLHIGNYQGPRNCALAASRYIPESKRANAKVLDVGAGTGYVGVELSILGFLQIDALDASEDMLDKLKQKNVYSNVICAMILPYCPSTSIPTGSYDVVTASGALVPGHITVEGIDEIMRIIKPGGIFVLHQWTGSAEHEDFQHLPRFLAEQEGKKWTLLEKYRTPNYMPGHEGLLHIVRKI